MARNRSSVLLVQAVGLCATAWIIWSTAVAPRLGRLALAGIVAGALKYAVLACLWSGAVTLGLYVLVARPERGDPLRIALRTCATAVWFAPAVILLAELSPAVLCAALVLIVSTTRLLYSQWRSIPTEIAVPAARDLFEPAHAPFRAKDLAPSFTASFSFEAGIAAMLMGYALVAASLFSLCVAMLTLSLLVAGVVEAESRTSLPRSILGVLLTVILAAGLTVGGLMRSSHAGFVWGRPRGFVESARALVEKLLQNKPAAEPPEAVVKLYMPRSGNVEISDESYPGVILWPETEPPKPLVAPTARSWRAAPAQAEETLTSIRFTGEYWMFRPEYARPPRSSYSQRASPLDLSFVTTDHVQMRMEAVQKLDHPIDLSCCSAIGLEISNEDRYPGTVALELLLIDTQAEGRAVQSLGKHDIGSWPRGRWNAPVAPVGESLHFAIPRPAAVRQFDEIRIVFHRARLRGDRSARIAIERFVLVP